MGLSDGVRSWWLVGVFAVASCTAVANGRLDGAGATGGSSSSAGGESIVDPPDKKPVGSGCTNPSECASGFCVDDVCCDQKCDGDCVACDLFNQNGVCQALVGQSCPTGACNAEGACVPLEVGMCTLSDECVSEFCQDGVCCNEACKGPCQSCADHTQTTIPDGLCAYEPSDDAACGGAGCVGKGLCCGDPKPAPGGACPDACTGGCNGNTCIIACEANACKGVNITCPVGFDCQIECVGQHACQSTAIDCPADHDCSIQCDSTVDGNHACEDVVFTCSNGPCSMNCVGDEPCKGTAVNCGANACSVTCGLGNVGDPTVRDDNDACSVTDCP